MTTGQNTFGPGLPPSSTVFVHFALDVVQLLQQAGPGGLDQDSFLNAYFRGNPPVGQADQDAWWEEFKRAREYSNNLFDKGISPWAMIRARPGARRGQYFYHIVGQRDNDRVNIEPTLQAWTCWMTLLTVGGVRRQGVDNGCGQQKLLP